MPRSTPKITKYHTIDVDDVEVSIKSVGEHRSSMRAAFGKKEIIVRYPLTFDLADEQRALDWARDWLLAQYAADPTLFDRYTDGVVASEGLVTVMGLDVPYQIEPVRGHEGTVTYDGDGLRIHIPHNIPTFEKASMRRKLLSKWARAVYGPLLKQRVHEINDAAFGVAIKRISLKYNTSNWGSCSTRGIINLSTRLLLVRQRAIDYVIIHELCHFLHMDHSPAFYEEIARRMPDYREEEKYLSSRTFDF